MVPHRYSNRSSDSFSRRRRALRFRSYRSGTTDAGGVPPEPRFHIPPVMAPAVLNTDHLHVIDIFSRRRAWRMEATKTAATLIATTIPTAAIPVELPGWTF